MMVDSEFISDFVCAKDSVGLMEGRRFDRNRPESVIHSNSSDDDLIVFQNLDIVLREDGETVIIADFREQNQHAGFELTEFKCVLSLMTEVLRERKRALDGGYHWIAAG
jgi:hypothetical protein